MEIPVSLSPYLITQFEKLVTLIRAWWMGAAPRYFGNNEGCILIPPSLKHEITWGGMK